MTKTMTQLLTTGRRLRVGENVYVRIVREPHRRAEVAILIDDKTSVDNLRAAWPTIERVRDQLFEKQGTDFGNAVVVLRLQHFGWHVIGYSYAEIAMRINYDCLVNLCAAKLGYEQQDFDSYAKRLYYFQVNLEAVRFKVRDIFAYAVDGFEQVLTGHAPWSLTTGPVDKDRVYAAIRQLKRDSQSSKFIVKEPPTIVSLDSEQEKQVQQVNQPAQNMADELLKRLPDSGGLQLYIDAIERVRSKGVEKSG